MCEYISQNGKKCQQPSIAGSRFCALHTPFPEYTESTEFRDLMEIKEARAREKVDADDFNFEGAILDSFTIPIHTEGNLNFTNTHIRGDAWFGGAQIGGDARFEVAKIDRDARFEGTKIAGSAWFVGAEIGRDAWFKGTEIGGDAWFDKTEIGRSGWFEGAIIGRSAWFEGTKIKYFLILNDATINGSAHFASAFIGGEARFSGATIKNDVDFTGTEIMKNVFFHYSIIYGEFLIDENKFRKPEAREEGYRKARRIQEELGRREEADRYYVLEMRERRERRLLELNNNTANSHELLIYWKKVPILFEEFFIDGLFRYGTTWQRVMGLWLFAIVASAFLFYCHYMVEAVSGAGISTAYSFLENLYFSVLTITTLGYGDFHPKTGIPWLIAGMVAIFGMFIWAAFIAIFSRKYMR